MAVFYIYAVNSVKALKLTNTFRPTSKCTEH